MVAVIIFSQVKKKKCQEDKHFVNPCTSPAFQLWVYLWDIYLFVYSPPQKKIIMQLINLIAWGMPIRKKKNAGSWMWHIMALNSLQKTRNLSSKMSIVLCPEMLGAGGGTVAGTDTLFFIFSIFCWRIVDLRCSIHFWYTKQSDSVINVYILFIVFSTVVYFRIFNVVPCRKLYSGTLLYAVVCLFFRSGLCPSLLWAGFLQ